MDPLSILLITIGAAAYMCWAIWAYWYISQSQRNYDKELQTLASILTKRAEGLLPHSFITVDTSQIDDSTFPSMYTQKLYDTYRYNDWVVTNDYHNRKKYIYILNKDGTTIHDVVDCIKCHARVFRGIKGCSMRIPLLIDGLTVYSLRHGDITNVTSVREKDDFTFIEYDC